MAYAARTHCFDTHRGISCTAPRPLYSPSAKGFVGVSPEVLSGALGGLPTKPLPPGSGRCCYLASSHAAASEFPHTCGRNESGNAQVTVSDDFSAPTGQTGSTGAAGVGPPAWHQVSMPTEQCLGLDKEPPAGPMAKEPTKTGEQSPVARPHRRA
jgi:hypothetical protein